MLGRLLLLFTVVPLIELWLLLQLSGVVGLPATIAMVLVTGVLGATLAKQEGLRTLQEWQVSLSQGQMPRDGLASGLLLLVGGVFLVTPGVLTDLTGLLLLVPPVRRALADTISARARDKITVHTNVAMPHFGAHQDAPPHQGGAVIDVDYVDEASTPASERHRASAASRPSSMEHS